MNVRADFNPEQDIASDSPLNILQLLARRMKRPDFAGPLVQLLPASIVTINLGGDCI
jgi:hypothetical protein